MSHVLTSAADIRGEAFRANAATMRALLDTLGRRAADATAGGPPAARDKHVARGKLLPRDRVDELLDEGSPFLELAPLAATG